MYLIQAGEYTIPVTMNSKIKGAKLYGKWDTFEVRCNPSVPREQTLKFIKSRENFFNQHMNKMKQKLEKVQNEIKQNEYKLITRDKHQLKKIISEYVDYYGERRGVVNKIFINSNMRKNWATCSNNNNLTFNKILCYLPKHLIKYIVYHEMCHLTIKNHGPQFYKLMQEEYPYYQQYDQELEVYNYLISRKLHTEKINKYKSAKQLEDVMIT